MRRSAPPCAWHNIPPERHLSAKRVIFAVFRWLIIGKYQKIAALCGQITDVPSPQEVTIKPISAGRFYRPTGHPQDAPDLLEEYPIHFAGNITFDSNDMIDAKMIRRCNWFSDPEFEVLGHLLDSNSKCDTNIPRRHRIP